MPIRKERKDNAPVMSAQPRTAILFVCLGNICRSPLAEGVLRAVVSERGLGNAFEIDSAALGSWHAGEPPDSRSVAVAHRFGVDISGQRARLITAEDFARFDLIFGMDRANVRRLRQLAPEEAQGRIHMLLHFALGREEEVPDPYYGGEADFLAVYGRIREACEALADRFAAWDGSAASSGHASSTI